MLKPNVGAKALRTLLIWIESLIGVESWIGDLALIGVIAAVWIPLLEVAAVVHLLLTKLVLHGDVSRTQTLIPRHVILRVPGKILAELGLNLLILQI